MRPTTTLFAFAAATAAVTLAFAWPTTTHADGASPLVQYMVDGSKIRDVVAKGTVSRDANTRSGWSVVVTARNDTDHAETVPLETDLTQRTMSPMARTAPMPRTVWSKTETVTVPAHGEAVRRYEVPAAVAAQLVAAETTRKDAAPGPHPVVSFALSFREPGPGKLPQGGPQPAQHVERLPVAQRTLAL